MVGGVGAAVADTVSADSPEFAEFPGGFQNRCFLLRESSLLAREALSRDAFLTFGGQPRTNRLLLRTVLDHGRPRIVSEVGVSREASQDN